MNILFIHETEYIEKVIFEYQIVPEILASRGHQVSVIDFPSNWRKKAWWDFGSLRTTYLRDVKRAGKKRGITLIRPGFLKIPAVSRLMAFFAYWWLIPSVIRSQKIDCIVLYSAPTNGIQAMYWAKKLGVPVFFRLFDVLHELVPFKILKATTKAIEKRVYQQADFFAATTPKLLEYGQILGAPKKYSCYLPTGADADLFHPCPKDRKLMKALGLEEKDVVVGFAGTLFNFSELDSLILYLAAHQQELKNIKLLISGRGEQEARLRELVSAHHLEGRVLLTGFISYQDLPDYINLADVCINLFDINRLTQDIIPGKIYQYLACEKPVIATRLPGMVNVFPEQETANSIYYCDERNFEQFFSLVKKVQHVTVKNDQPTLQDIASEYEKILSTLVNKRNDA